MTTKYRMITSDLGATQRLDVIETTTYRLTYPVAYNNGFFVLGPGVEAGPFTIEELIEKGVAVEQRDE